VALRPQRSPALETPCPAVAPRTVTVLALLVGVVGGIYGIGGGSILGPILVGTGMSGATVAPAALASTFATSLVGAITYGLLAVVADGAVAPDRVLGVVCGAGRTRRRVPRGAVPTADAGGGTAAAAGRARGRPRRGVHRRRRPLGIIAARR
jgi:hypothetical protein